MQRERSDKVKEVEDHKKKEEKKENTMIKKGEE